MEEVFGSAGDLIFKPRGEWHTFWNAGDVPARILELISPGGFERAFEGMHAMRPEAMSEVALRYGGEVDFEASVPLMEQHGLKF